MSDNVGTYDYKEKVNKYIFQNKNLRLHQLLNDVPLTHPIYIKVSKGDILEPQDIDTFILNIISMGLDIVHEYGERLYSVDMLEELLDDIENDIVHEHPSYDSGMVNVKRQDIYDSLKKTACIVITAGT